MHTKSEDAHLYLAGEGTDSDAYGGEEAKGADGGVGLGDRGGLLKLVEHRVLLELWSGMWRCHRSR